MCIPLAALLCVLPGCARQMHERPSPVVPAPIVVLEPAPSPSPLGSVPVPEADGHAVRLQGANGQPGIAFKFREMEVEADGATNAYHPDNEGALDYIANAFSVRRSVEEPALHAGNADAKILNTLLHEARGRNFEGYPKITWFAVETTPDGRPVELPGGYYLSTTAFQFASNGAHGTPYVDAASIPFIALSRDMLRGASAPARLGDFVVVRNDAPGNAPYVFGIVGDQRSNTWKAEGSVALAEALGGPRSGFKASHSLERNATVLVLAGQNVGATRKTAGEIAQAAKVAFEAWGGAGRLSQYDAVIPSQ